MKEGLGQATNARAGVRASLGVGHRLKDEGVDPPSDRPEGRRLSGAIPVAAKEIDPLPKS